MLSSVGSTPPAADRLDRGCARLGDESVSSSGEGSTAITWRRPVRSSGRGRSERPRRGTRSANSPHRRASSGRFLYRLSRSTRRNVRVDVELHVRGRVAEHRPERVEGLDRRTRRADRAGGSGSRSTARRRCSTPACPSPSSPGARGSGRAMKRSLRVEVDRRAGSRRRPGTPRRLRAIECSSPFLYSCASST